MPVLDLVFGTQGHLLWWQECGRALVVFLYGLAAIRIAGRRLFGKWAALDIVVSITAGSNLSRALTGSAPFAGTLAATTQLIVLHWVLASAAARWRAVSWLVEGLPQVLARGGEIDHGPRIRHAVSEADIDEALRKAGVADMAQTRAVTLEPSGTITVVKA